MLRALLLAAAVLLVAAPSASALSCLAGPGALPDPYKTHGAVIEGIALSGPSVLGGSLASPARFLVTRWVRGSGPRIVRVTTAVSFGVGPYYSVLAGGFMPSAGRVSRLFGRMRRGVFVNDECALGDSRPSPRPSLDDVSGSAVRAAAGSRAWRAHAQRGRGGLHCIVVHPVGRHTGGGKECEVGRPIVAVQHEGPGTKVESTAIVVGGPGVGAVRLRTPDGVRDLRPAQAGAPVLVVLGGDVDAAEIRARVDGRWMQPIGFPTLLVADPDLGRPWLSALDDLPAVSPFGLGPVDLRTCVGARQVAPRRGTDDDAIDGDFACGDLRLDPYFFARRVLRHGEGTGALEPEARRTIVLGAVGRSVAAVVVRDPHGERRLTPGPGGQFLAVYPASVRPEELVVEVVFRNGATAVHRGAGGVNLR